MDSLLLLASTAGICAAVILIVYGIIRSRKLLQKDPFLVEPEKSIVETETPLGIISKTATDLGIKVDEKVETDEKI